MREIKKVAIIGMGALGVAYGSQLTKKLGRDNVFFVANKERIRRYEAEGVYCNGEKCDFRYVDRDSTGETADLLIFAVKYTGLEEAISDVKNVIGDNTLIISVLNGIVSEQDIQAVYGEDKVLYCVAAGADAVKEKNKLRYQNIGILQLGTKDGKMDERLKAVAALFDKTQVVYELSEDIRFKLWSKLMLNTGINQVVAVFETTYGGVQKPGEERDMMLAAMREVQAVASFENIELTDGEIERWMGVTDGLAPDGMPSMRQDTKAHRKTEVELFSGTIRRLGKKYGVPTPINDFLYEEITKLESEYALDKITRCIQEIDVAEWTSEMIQIQSYSFMDRQEEAIAHYIHDVFQREGIESEVVEIEPGRFNVNARLAGGSAGSSLMLSGHMDTVPAYDFEDAFSGRRADGKVYGRGACDMKGPLAAMMAALVGIHRSGVKLAGDLIFTGVADEEEKGKGVAYLIKNGPTADAVIVGEPTNMQVALGHKGLEWIEVRIHGKKVHGGSKKEGINAIQMASRFVNRIYDYYEPILDSREYPILGVPTINVGTIAGGDQPSTVPGSCSIRLDRRCVPTETIEQVYKELKDLAAELTEQDPRFHAEIRDVFEGDNLLPHEPFCTDPEAPIVKAVERAIGLAKGPEPVLTAFPAWTDAGFVSNGTDSTCLVMGPGELAVAHSVEEHIKEADLNYAALVYAYTAVDYCGIGSNGRAEDGR